MINFGAIRQRSGIAALLVLVPAALSLGGCAGALRQIVGGGHDLTKELPKDLADKFEVKDETVAQPSPTPSPVPAIFPEKKGKGKGKQKAPAQRPAQLTAGKVQKKPSKAPQVATGTTAPSIMPSPQPSPVLGPDAPISPQFKYLSRRPPKEPIWLGEQQVWDVSYFGVAAGEVTLDVLPYKSVANRKVYHVRGKARTSDVFALFYKVDDMVETFIDYEGIFSHRFHILLNETKQWRDSLELNDSERAQTFYWNKWDRKDRGFTETKEYKQIQPFSQDTLSALFYLRTLPLKDGDVYTVPVVSEGKTWEGVVTVVGREMMKTPMGRISTIKLQPETKFQGVLKKTGDSYVWLTDDDRRFLVRMEAKVKIGTVVTSLKSMKPGTPPEPEKVN